MKATAIVRILERANRSGEAYTLSIGLTGGPNSIQDAALLEYWASENTLLVRVPNVGEFFIDGEHIDILKVNQ